MAPSIKNHLRINNIFSYASRQKDIYLEYSVYMSIVISMEGTKCIAFIGSIIHFF
jgi:hypothetical protein